MKTLDDILKLNPCKDGEEFLRNCASLEEAWNTCQNPSWMVWALNTLSLWDEEQQIKFGCHCALRVVHVYEHKFPKDKLLRECLQEVLNNYSEVSVKKCRDATYVAAYANAHAYAANAAAVDAAERTWQANKLREIIPFNTLKL